MAVALQELPPAQLRPPASGARPHHQPDQVAAAQRPARCSRVADVDIDTATGARDAVQLGEDRVRVEGRIEDAVGTRGVDASVRDGEGGRVHQSRTCATPCGEGEPQGPGAALDGEMSPRSWDGAGGAAPQPGDLPNGDRAVGGTGPAVHARERGDAADAEDDPDGSPQRRRCPGHGRVYRWHRRSRLGRA